MARPITVAQKRLIVVTVHRKRHIEFGSISARSGCQRLMQHYRRFAVRHFDFTQAV